MKQARRVCLSIGRSVQEPMCEMLHNWKEDPRENKLLLLELHPLQKYLEKGVLHGGLE